ncbi:MAG: hypothetical protein AMJ73_00305 [candidate division Zixibacteria bacterium SM1_73]|nr:MAG: hypothetical protein AMJ73_00305 [candidate division Zixibacteria bacterium SM1_73]
MGRIVISYYSHDNLLIELGFDPCSGMNLPNILNMSNKSLNIFSSGFAFRTIAERHQQKRDLSGYHALSGTLRVFRNLKLTSFEWFIVKGLAFAPSIGYLLVCGLYDSFLADFSLKGYPNKSIYNLR